MTKTTYLPLLLAGLLAAAGAQAQSTPAAGSSDGPPKAGEASTFVQGAPNATAAPQMLSRAEVQSELLSRRARFEATRRAMLSSGARG